MLVERYFELVEQEWSSVSSSWKIIHIIFLISAVISGVCYSFVFGSIRILFGSNCFLFPTFYPNENIQAKSSFVKPPLHNEVKRNNHDLINSAQISYNSLFFCNFIEFFPLFSSIFACILIALLLLYGKGGNSIKNGLRSPWRLIAPATIITFFLTLTLVINTRYYFEGLSRFSEKFTTAYGNKSNDQIFLTVTKLYDFEKPLIDLNINELLELQVFVSTILLCSWVITFIVFFTRVVTIADFQLICISVYSEEEHMKNLPLNNRQSLNHVKKKKRRSPYFSLEKEMSRLSLFTGSSSIKTDENKSNLSTSTPNLRKNSSDLFFPKSQEKGNNIQTSNMKVHFFHVPEAILKQKEFVNEPSEIELFENKWSSASMGISPSISEPYNKNIFVSQSTQHEITGSDSELELVVIDPDEEDNSLEKK